MTTPTRADLLALIDEMAASAKKIVAERNAAYASSGDVFGNLNLIETLTAGQLSTEFGIVLRMGDKVSRLASLTRGGIDPGSEKLEDTSLDLMGYAALLILRHRTRGTAGTGCSPEKPQDPPAPPAA